MTIMQICGCIGCVYIIVITGIIIHTLYHKIIRTNNRVGSYIKKYPETHQRGMLSVETKMDSNLDCDFGVMIAEDGRVWICIDGMAFIRFKPKNIYKLGIK